MVNKITDPEYWKLSDVSYRLDPLPYYDVKLKDRTETWKPIQRVDSSRHTGFNATIYKNGNNVVVV
jgi:hypothetical protein